MCLNPTIRENKRYKPTKKNGYGKYGIEKPDNKKKLFIIQKCGKCEECRRERGKMWQIRLIEEMKKPKAKPYFVTLTINDEWHEKLKNKVEEKYNKLIKEEIKNENNEKVIAKYKEKIKDPNEISIIAVRHFCQRWQMKFGKTIRHWFISELGHKQTERLHLHGIIWQDEEYIKPTIKRYSWDKGNDILSKMWKYGIVFTGDKCNRSTAAYITKYITKEDEKHPEFFGKVLTSPGLGKEYLNEQQIKICKKNWENNKEIFYKNEAGFKMAMPIYYRNKIWTEKERAQIWSELLKENKNKGIHEGISLNTEEGIDKYIELIKHKRNTKAYKDKLKPFDKDGFRAKLINMYVK